MQYQPFTRDYVQRLTDGDDETERHFVTYFSELLVIKLRRTLRCHQALDDIRQETFLRVFRVLRNHGLTSPESLGAFVNSVCNNVLAEFYRSSARLSPFPEGGVTLAVEQPGPEAELETKERKRDVYRILEELPAKDRQILRMLFLEERAKDDVCRVCEVDRNYLRVLLHRAKIRFRNQSHKPAAVAHSAALV